MQQLIFICLFGILFLIVSNHGEQVVIVDGDGSRALKTRDHSIRESVGEPLIRRHFSDLNELFQRRQASGFTANQRLYQQYALEAHNKHRARHCASPLKLDDTLSRSAQNYAEYLARIDQMVHSGTSGLGENLYWEWSSGGIKTISGQYTHLFSTMC